MAGAWPWQKKVIDLTELEAELKKIDLQIEELEEKANQGDTCSKD